MIKTFPPDKILTRHGWSLSKNANSTGWTSGTIITPTWEVENEDTDKFHNGTDNYITVPAGLGGIYVVQAELQFSFANDTLSQEARIMLNGSSGVRGTMSANAGYGRLSGGGCGAAICGIMYLPDLSTCNVSAYQATGSTQSIIQYVSMFQGYRISD